MNTMNAYTLRKFQEAGDLPPRTGPLAAANFGFHETYNRLVADAVAQLGERLPVLVMIGDDLALLCDGKAQREEVIPAPYHELKALGHVAFGVQLTLIANGSGPLTDLTANELRAKRAPILEARAAADALSKPLASPLPADLLRHTLALVDKVLVDGVIDLKRLHHDIRALASLALEVGRLAVRIELERLHALVGRWRKDLGEERWADLYVVICGNHQPRYREAASQYFARLLHEPEGFAAEREERLLYGEGLNEVDAALDLLARHIVDQRASRLLFGDRRRLQRDLFADVAAAQLRELFSVGHR